MTAQELARLQGGQSIELHADERSCAIGAFEDPWETLGRAERPKRER
jgi:hypothetical protein